MYRPINKICISVNSSVILQLIRFRTKRVDKSKQNNLKSINMNINYKSMQEVSSYVAPSVKALEVLSEGVLCGSYGEAGAAGKDLDQENSWDF